MISRLIIAIAVWTFLASTTSVAAASPGDGAPELPQGVQGYTLFGEALVSGQPDNAALEKLDAARAAYEQDPGDADSIIWYGRRMAYTGNYRSAIRIFSEGMEKHPRDARMYRRTRSSRTVCRTR